MKAYNFVMISIKKIFKTLYYILLTIIIIIAIGVITPLLPIPGNYQMMTVLSGSMEPAIHTGSVAIVKPMKSYGIGDIITFGKATKTETPITHRIYDMRIQESNPIYVTKGDANNAHDQREITANEIIGKVLFSVPYAGYAVEAAKKPIGFILIIIIPAVVIVGDELRKIWKEIIKLRNKKKDKEQDKEIKGLKEEIEKLKEEK